MPTRISSATVLLVEGNDHRNFFEAFRDHLGISPLQRPEKAQTTAFLATTPDPHVSVGVAAKKKVWSFDHDAFRTIREFLSRLGG